MARFQMKIDRQWAPMVLVGAATRSNSYVEVTPEAISDIVRTEQGAMIIPSVRKDPEDIDAPISPIGCQASASLRISAVLRSVSYLIVISAALETTR